MSLLEDYSRRGIKAEERSLEKRKEAIVDQPCGMDSSSEISINPLFRRVAFQLSTSSSVGSSTCEISCRTKLQNFQVVQHVQFCGKTSEEISERTEKTCQ